MTYREHLREALRRSEVPIFAAEYALTAAADARDWLDDEFVPPDADQRLQGVWSAVKASVVAVLKEGGCDVSSYLTPKPGGSFFYSPDGP